MDNLNIDDLENEYYLVWRQRNILLNHLISIIGGKSASDISRLTGLPINRCEKIIDDCNRLNQGLEI